MNTWQYFKQSFVTCMRDAAIIGAMILLAVFGLASWWELVK